MLNLPGHTTESVVLIDRVGNQAFTGDFVYRHLGGIIAFAPASDLSAYKANSARLLRLTNAETQFFGAHGIPRFGRDWLTLLDKRTRQDRHGRSELPLCDTLLSPLASRGVCNRMATCISTPHPWSIRHYSGQNGCCWHW